MQIGLVPEPAVTESPEAAAGIETASPAAEAAVKRAAALIANAKRPVFYGGGGLINSGVDACHAFTSLVRDMAAPCTLTLMGLGAFPADDPLFLGMLGMHGTLEANLEIGRASCRERVCQSV